MTAKERTERIGSEATERLVEIWNMLCRWSDKKSLQTESLPTFLAVRDELRRRGIKADHAALKES